MSFLRLAATTSAFALLSGPALAVTPEEVWDKWQTFLQDNYGATLEIGSEASEGETLTIENITVSSESPDQSFEAIVPELIFENIGDGRVRVTMSDVIPMAMGFVVEDGDTATATMAMTQPGASLIASGPNDAIRYDFDYPTVTLGDFAMNATDMPDEVGVTFDMVLNGLTGFLATTDAGTQAYASETELADLSVAMNFSDASEDNAGTGSFSLTIEDLSQTITGTFGDLSPGATLSEIVTSGTSQDGIATHGPATYSISVDGMDGSFELASAAESGEIAGALGPDGLRYGTNTRNITMTIGGTTIPLPPVALRIAETGGVFQMPLVPGPDTQEFGLVMNLMGLEVDDMIWSLFDPTGALPRDPANLVIDLSGTGILSADVTDPEFGQSGEDMEAAGELQTITVNQLLLSLAGAELTGEGDFAFNNDSGIPMPAGTARLSLTGGNQLLDTLVGMGLIPEEQAMGARMMLGLFARPDGDDSLVSEIEVTEDGQVLANGQRIR